MDDLVKRLRVQKTVDEMTPDEMDGADFIYGHEMCVLDGRKAADRIEAQAAEIARYQKALKRIRLGEYDGLEVTPLSGVDREAAATLIRLIFPNTEGAGDGMAAGQFDDCPTVQIFATHRALGRRQGIEEVVAWLRGRCSTATADAFANTIEADFLK